MNTKLNKDEILKLIQGADDVYVTVDNYRIGESRKAYYDVVDNIYEEMMKNIDDLEFPVDRVAIVRENYSYNETSTLLEIFNVLTDMDIQDIDGFKEIQDSIDKENFDEKYYDDLEDLPLEKIKVKYPSFYENVRETLDQITNDNINIYIDGETLFDCQYIEEAIDEHTTGALAYWTAYYSPSYKDVDVALKVGLTPFEYNGTFYLALGGCGMDLSPRLDAYISLCYNRIPRDSTFFNDTGYFEYVVGGNVCKEINKKCKLEKPSYNISFSV